MNKLIALLVIAPLLLACKSSTKETEVYRSETLLIERASKHVYHHLSYMEFEGYGKVSCNGMIVCDGKEAIVFDTPSDDEVSFELIDCIYKMLGCRVIAVIPTHYHLDNLGGLEAFHQRGIPSYAYRKTIEKANELACPIPQHSFDSLLVLNVGKEKVYAGFLGEGHTCDNVIGYFPSEHVMFGGCLIKETGAGKGNLAEANPGEWAATVRRVQANYPETRLVIPGHGKPGGQELLDYTIHLFE